MTQKYLRGLTFELSAALITPVPGGVGPTMIALLLQQTVDAAVDRAAQGARRT
jgi:5,10-methylene-tetrahydrofolate dehydrogenase/methenyl tetrahydrofolate cyclohydrolase